MQPEPKSSLNTVASWTSVILVALMSLAYFGIICWRGYADHAWLKITQEHFAAVVGLPAAAVGSLFLVLVVQWTEGPIEVELGAVKFKGAAAPIVFWILCFMAMAWAIKMLWTAG
jgi:hypothetical protein